MILKFQSSIESKVLEKFKFCLFLKFSNSHKKCGGAPALQVSRAEAWSQFFPARCHIKTPNICFSWINLFFISSDFAFPSSISREKRRKQREERKEKREKRREKRETRPTSACPSGWIALESPERKPGWRFTARLQVAGGILLQVAFSWRSREFQLIYNFGCLSSRGDLGAIQLFICLLKVKCPGPSKFLQIS